jgi:peptidoglycan/LPS O-acetylase OafA/YrhL
MTSNTTNESPAVASLEHRPELDGVRGLAVLMVVCYHSNLGLNHSNVGEKLWQRVSGCGWTGVDLFFVLSGFLITGILLDSRGSSHFFRNFYMRRTLRIFPLYYLVLVLLLWLLPPFNGESWHWFYLQNWYCLFWGNTFPMPIQPFWSLAVEEQFYLVWPLAIYFLSRRQLAGLCVGLMIIALGARCMARWYGAETWGIYTATCFRMDALAAGSLLAIVLRNSSRSRDLDSTLLSLLGISCVGLAIAVWCDQGLVLDRTWNQCFGYSCQAVAYAALLGLIVVGNRWVASLRWILNSKVLRHLGNRSYAIYLLHFPIFAPFVEIYWRRNSNRNASGYGDCLMMAAAFLTTLVLAELSWHLFEKPFLKLKRFFPRNESTSPAAWASSNTRSDLSSAGQPASS